MTNAEHHAAPAAWYPDERDSSQLRWWTGTDWTDHVRPVIAAVPPVEEQPNASIAALLQTRRSLNAVAQPAQGFGHASPEQLRSWAAPSFGQRREIPTPVNEVPREWGAATALTRRQLREMVGPLTTETP